MGCPSAGAQRFRALAQRCWGDDGQQLPSRGSKHLALLPWGWQNVPCLGKALGLPSRSWEPSPHGTQPVGTVSCPRGGEGAAEPQDCLAGVFTPSLPVLDAKVLECQFLKGEGFHHRLSIRTFRIRSQLITSDSSHAQFCSGLK